MATPVGFVLIGNVDNGKSTVAGQILYLSGAIDEREYEKNKAEPCHLLDVLDEEKTRGITVEVGRLDVQIKECSFVLLDCPGHKDYVSDVLSNGLSMASIAILVISARKGELDAAMKDRIPELLLFLKGYNIPYIVVAINKMDMINWEREEFTRICGKTKEYLSKYRLTAYAYVPISGISGAHIRDAHPGVDTPTLFDVLLDIAGQIEKAPTPVMTKVTTIPRLLLRTTGNNVITKGFRCILHFGDVTVDCEVTGIKEIVEAKTTGAPVVVHDGKAKTLLRKNEKAIVSLQLAKEISYNSALTFCVLRTFKDTVGVGEVLPVETTTPVGVPAAANRSP